MADSTGAAWMSFEMDMNADGEITFSDVWLWIVHVFFIPGDGVVWGLLSYAPWLAQFFEIGSGSYGGLFSAIVSAAAWLFGFALLGAISSLVIDFDRALTGRVTRIFQEWRRRGRVLRTWLSCQARGFRDGLSRRPRERTPEIDLDELNLGELEIEVLRSHAFLPPGYVLGISDLATSLEIRRAQAQKLLDKLETLELLQRRFGSSNGETGYRLSAQGQFVLMAHSRIAGD